MQRNCVGGELIRRDGGGWLVIRNLSTTLSRKESMGDILEEGIYGWHSRGRNQWVTFSLKEYMGYGEEGRVISGRNGIYR